MKSSMMMDGALDAVLGLKPVKNKPPKAQISRPKKVIKKRMAKMKGDDGCCLGMN